jgi:hypothetical protein
MLRWLQVDRDLGNLGFWQLLLTITVATAAGSLASSAYAVAFHGRPDTEWLASALAMLVGDFVGVGVVVMLGMTVLRCLRRPRGPHGE